MATKTKKSALRAEIEGKTVANIALQVSGLFSFPVKLYTPYTNGESYTLRLGCPDCKSPVVQPRRCSNDKCTNHDGFPDYSKPIRVAVEGEAVVEIKDTELEELNLPTVEAFVTDSVLPLKDVEALRMFGDGGYYLVPENIVSNMAYCALAKALKKTKQCIVGRYTLRGKVERLGLVVPIEGPDSIVLAIQNIPYASQVKDLPKFEEANITSKEVSQAEALLTAVASTPFIYEGVTDRYADAMRELVKEKLSSGSVKPKRRAKAKAEDAPADRARNMLSEMFAAAGV